MTSVINSIRSDLNSWERLDITIRIDGTLMQATPMDNGKWHVVIKNGDTQAGSHTTTQKNVEQIAINMLQKCEDRQFAYVQERDASGYCIANYYEAQGSETRKKNRVFFRRKRSNDAIL